MRDVVEFGEEASGVGSAEAGELVAGLFTEVGAVPEEEDAAGVGLGGPIGEGLGAVEGKDPTGTDAG